MHWQRMVEPYVIWCFKGKTVCWTALSKQKNDTIRNLILFEEFFSSYQSLKCNIWNILNAFYQIEKALQKQEAL